VVRQVVGMPIGTNCVPLIADCFYTAVNLKLWNKTPKRSLPRTR
jgi:hypothetical protein